MVQRSCNPSPQNKTFTNNTVSEPPIQSTSIDDGRVKT